MMSSIALAECYFRRLLLFPGPVLFIFRKLDQADGGCRSEAKRAKKQIDWTEKQKMDAGMDGSAGAIPAICPYPANFPP